MCKFKINLKIIIEKLLYICYCNRDVRTAAHCQNKLSANVAVNKLSIEMRGIFHEHKIFMDDIIVGDMDDRLQKKK